MQSGSFAWKATFECLALTDTDLKRAFAATGHWGLTSIWHSASHPWQIATSIVIRVDR